MSSPARSIGVALAAICAFVNLYAPQPLLPLIRRQFDASAVEVSHLMSACTLAMALIAPFTGAVADMIGRKKVIATAMVLLIVPTVMIAFADSVSAMVFWRFVQGLLLPPIFVVTVAYIGDELPPREATHLAGFYVSASSVGGFSGRLISGWLAGPYGVRGAYLGLATLTAIVATGFILLLPREKRFVRSANALHGLGHMLGHLFDAKLVPIFAIGFITLFMFIGLFTYVSFHLAAPPYDLSSAALGTLFVVYLAGSSLTPLVGKMIHRFGRRTLAMGLSTLCIVGMALTLAPNLIVIIAGLAVASCGGLLMQATSTGYVTVAAERARSSAVGLYVTCFYVGGSFGAVLPGYVWDHYGWSGCVALLVVAQLLAILIVACFWRESHAAPSA